MRSPFALACLFLAGAAASTLRGQNCTTADFQSGPPGSVGIAGGYAGAAREWFDGTSLKLFIGGSFNTGGPLSTNGLVAYDIAANQWSRPGTGLSFGNTNGFVTSILPFTFGAQEELVVAGFFASAGGAANTKSIARWNGTRWLDLGTNFVANSADSVWSMCVWNQPGGSRRLVIGGNFPNIGSVTGANGIAFFDGVGWNALGTGISGGFSPNVFALAVYNDQLYAGGRFTGMGGVASPLVARWNGTAWERPGAGLTANGPFSDISALIVYDNGTGPALYAGGSDFRVGSTSCSVARWNGTTWTAVGQNLGGRTTCFAVSQVGAASGSRLYAGGTAQPGIRYFYRLEGNQWTTVSGGVQTALSSNFPSVFGLYAASDRLWVLGDFQQAGSVPAYGVARLGCVGCDSIDFNNDTVFPDAQDIADLLSVYGGGPCSTDPTPGCNDIDFNNNGVFPENDDIAAFLRVFGGGGC